TSEIAIHAALTGHLVISTLHTNDAVGTISRLLDMGTEPYLISSALICVAAQRLVRRICDGCKTEEEATPELMAELGVRVKGRAPVFYRGKGCPACKDTGYKGRIGIYEVLVPDDDLRALMLAKKDASAIFDAARRKGFQSLRIQGLKAAAAGYTTVEEVLQATQVLE
ncbi:MAG: GspE/PulE family protein, partial [Thermodesulfobacteriota bacterium]